MVPYKNSTLRNQDNEIWGKLGTNFEILELTADLKM